MPAVLTHYSFAKEMVPEEEKDFFEVLRIGTQGPDTFMACSTIPWRKRENGKHIKQFGYIMHGTPIAKTYYRMMEYARKSEYKDVLFAYIDGILMHFSVDRVFHPYIFYRSGFDENGGITGYFGYSHGAFEALLDKVVGKRKGTYQNPAKAIKCNKEYIKEISKMWAACADYDLKDDSFVVCYEDFVSSMKLLFTRSGIKRILFRMMGKYSIMMSMSHPRFIKKYEKMDILNLKHRTWKNPATLKEYNDSFDDLWVRSKQYYTEVHKLLLRAKNGENIEKELDVWADNTNHDGCPFNDTKKEYKLCWDEIK